LNSEITKKQVTIKNVSVDIANRFAKMAKNCRLSRALMFEQLVIAEIQRKQTKNDFSNLPYLDPIKTEQTWNLENFLEDAVLRFNDNITAIYGIVCQQNKKIGLRFTSYDPNMVRKEIRYLQGAIHRDQRDLQWDFFQVGVEEFQILLFKKIETKYLKTVKAQKKIQTFYQTLQKQIPEEFQYRDLAEWYGDVY
jgi:hypothetical protein